MAKHNPRGTSDEGEKRAIKREAPGKQAGVIAAVDDVAGEQLGQSRPGAEFER